MSLFIYFSICETYCTLSFVGVGETKRMCRETGRFAAHPLILFVVIGFPCTLSNHLPK